MSFWDEFKEVVDRKTSIVIIVSVFVSTLATVLSTEIKFFSFEPTIISTTLNLFLLVMGCFGLAIISFLVLSAIGDAFKEKVEKHGLAKVLFFLLLVYVILNKFEILP